jgi:hypothetical protein
MAPVILLLFSSDLEKSRCADITQYRDTYGAPSAIPKVEIMPRGMAG